MRKLDAENENLSYSVRKSPKVDAVSAVREARSPKTLQQEEHCDADHTEDDAENLFGFNFLLVDDGVGGDDEYWCEGH